MKIINLRLTDTDFLILHQALAYAISGHDADVLQIQGSDPYDPEFGFKQSHIDSLVAWMRDVDSREYTESAESDYFPDLTKDACVAAMIISEDNCWHWYMRICRITFAPAEAHWQPIEIQEWLLNNIIRMDELYNTPRFSR